MISIQKDFVNIPKGLISIECTTLVKASITEKNKHKFQSKYYRDSILSDIEKIYHAKCAYCETNTIAGAPMQVEHYRPKAKVTEDKNHEGYYWIAYEWSNLILSCAKCNNKKRNRFPIEGERLKTPDLDVEGLPNSDCRIANSTLFQKEKALLLHPEIDNVEDAFIFLPNGEIEALDKNIRAEQTIKICGLNRKELIEKRLKMLNSFFNELQNELKELAAGEISIIQARHAIKRIFQRLALLQKSENEYSRFGYFMFTKFDKFFVERMPSKQGEAIKELFGLFKDNKL